MYVEAKKEFPKVGKRVTTPHGEAKAVKYNILSRTVTVVTDEGKEVTFPVEQVDRANLKFEW